MTMAFGSRAIARRESLLEVDPDLAQGLDTKSAALARRHLVVRLERVGVGEWEPQEDAYGAAGGIGLLVVEGLAVRRVALEHRSAGELLGPGDVLRPWQWELEGEHIAYPFSAAWRVVEPLTIAVLDPGFTRRVGAFPDIVGQLMGRAVGRAYRLAGYLVVAQLTAVDDRLLVAFWHLAEQWGRVRPDGVLLPLRVTHEILGFLVGARRPSVTAALGRLAEQGLVRPQSDGGWVLLGTPPERLRPQPRRRPLGG
jgi:CRP-like cAMP-binding protein